MLIDSKLTEIFYLQTNSAKEFQKKDSYNRFVELQQRAMLPLIMFLKIMKLGECFGISFVDSTPIKV